VKTPPLVSRTWKIAAPWLAPVAFIALLLAVFQGFWTRWYWLRPHDRGETWIAIGVLAAVVSAASAIAVAAIALRGLRSLRIARDEIVHRTATDAKLCAIHRLEEVAKELIPENTKVLDALVKAGVHVFLGPADKVVFEPDPTDLTAARAWRAGIPVPAYNLVTGFLNRLEAWSVYFTTGVADPEVAFGPIAPLLRSWVGQYYAILLIVRSGTGPSSGTFPNLVRLYLQWSAQMDTQQLARLNKDIEGQMQQAQARLVQSKLPDVVPKLS